MRVHKILVKEDIQCLKVSLDWLNNKYTDFMERHTEVNNHLSINEQLTQDDNVRLRERVF